MLSPLVRGERIEIIGGAAVGMNYTSPLVRGERIEIIFLTFTGQPR